MAVLTALIQATGKPQLNTSVDWDNKTKETTAQGNPARDKTLSTK